MKLEKLLIGEGVKATPTDLYIEIQKYLSIRDSHEPIRSSMAMRAVYKLCIEDMSNRYHISKNAVRKNIYWVCNWNKDKC